MNLQERVTRILKQPKIEWPVIESEPTDIATLYRSYIAPLAAIPAICGLIGLVVIGSSVPFVGRYRFGIAEALRIEVFQYVGQLIGCFVSAFIIAKLGPTFNSRDDQIQALKLVAYSNTPVWVAGVLNLIPALAVLIIFAAIYAVYLYYLGVPVLMKTPAEKVIPYMIVSVLVIIVVWFVIGAILGLAAGAASVARPTL
jgi:hypothetical protein